ncbi:Glycerol-3-phosphate dehydrogenase (NAD(+)) [Ananas comosus]|uniref:Glycerol-3-phosphate dehydrogenase [NAD(+)] n=1 Tax=Ananas comosus TaxID=4615 RepID=A0A199VMJ8_ANACO|nr:Glycerol-3-phosphate dehydrogenase (NAD(+)) [Ananas comosus]
MEERRDAIEEAPVPRAESDRGVSVAVDGGVEGGDRGATSEQSYGRVAVIGSGNWGSKLLDEVRMWVYEETLPNGEKLSHTINQTNENCKYLPGIKLGVNVIADPDLENAVKEANMLVFVTPHQFVEGICKRLVGKIRPGAEAISLIKGMEVKMEGPCMISKLISDMLGINCCVLMGANIANEARIDRIFSFAFIMKKRRENNKRRYLSADCCREVQRSDSRDKEVAQRWARLFGTPYFLVSVVQDVEGVELCGTLKNVVAIAAGLVDGLDMGNNTKAAIMRIGLREMRAFSKLLFSSVRDSTFFESCGVADLITTCQLLQGQKLQGVSTAKEVYEVLSNRGWQGLFPLFTTVHEICVGELPPTAIVEYSEHSPNVSIMEGFTQHYY